MDTGEQQEPLVVRRRERPTPRPRAVDVSAPVLDVPEGSCEVRSTAFGVETQEREVIRVPIFHTAPARVRVSAGVTESVGGYEFIRVDVSVELPCYPVESEINRAYAAATAIVQEKVNLGLDEGRSRFNGQAHARS